MAKPPSLSIDLSDPEAILAGIDKVEARLNEARGAFKIAAEELHHWEEIYERLRVLAGEPESTDGRSVRAMVIGIVNDRRGPTRADDVLGVLGASVERKTVNWALWDGAKQGDIKKLSTGVYAPKNYAPAASPFDGVLQALVKENLGAIDAFGAKAAADAVTRSLAGIDVAGTKAAADAVTRSLAGIDVAGTKAAADAVAKGLARTRPPKKTT